MSDRPISFRVCDFSEQIVCNGYMDHPVYSAVMHVDGEVYQWRYAMHREFSPPLSMLRSDAWLALLRKIAEAQANKKEPSSLPAIPSKESRARQR